MPVLTEIKNRWVHYYLDHQGRHHGECTRWDNNGQLRKHCLYEDGNLHGEYKYWYSDGQLSEHSFYKDNKDITNQVKELVVNINNITKEERMMIKLKFGIECLS